MKHHLVTLPADIPQHLAFSLRWAGEHRQRLSGVAGEDHLIKSICYALTRNINPTIVANNLLHRRVKVQRQAIAERIQHRADILPGAAWHHVPLWTMGNVQQTVVFKKA